MEGELLISIPDSNSNFDLVELKDMGNLKRLTPYCKLHGAMNKVSKEGYWRCTRAEPNKDYQKFWTRTNTDCRAGCIYNG